MNRAMLIIGAAVLGMALLAAAGCGSSTNVGVGADEGSDPTFAFRGHPGHPHVLGAGTGGAAGAGSATGSGGASASSSAGTSATPPATADVQAVIAAAQNPDGTAIPQGPGPNGECPEVLVLLGFWSCPQLGQTCSYTSGPTHHCQCDRIDGEGGLPAWVCDQ